MKLVLRLSVSTRKSRALYKILKWPENVAGLHINMHVMLIPLPRLCSKYTTITSS